MRKYSSVSPQFWIGATGKKLRAKGMVSQLVAMYLMTCPHANMLGLYYLPKIYLSHECGLSVEVASKGLQEAIEAGFCLYDDDSEMVWIPAMASYQIAPTLALADKRCLGVQNEYNGLPANPYLEPFFEKYGAVFHMTKQRKFEGFEKSYLEGPSEPLASQEQEQEQEHDQNQDKPVVEQKPLDVLVPVQAVLKEPLTPLTARVKNDQSNESDIQTIFEYWQKIMSSPKSVLDDKRMRLISNALKNYEPALICQAIRGCSKSPHNMGVNDRSTKYNGLNLILRDAERIDYFVNIDNAKAKPGVETIEQKNARVTAEFMTGEANNDHHTIEMET